MADITRAIPQSTTRHYASKNEYILPSDEVELQRLRAQHGMLLKLFDNRLVHVPVNLSQVTRILDVGTGSCAWLIDVAHAVGPDVELTGIDITANLFPSSNVPTNVTLKICSVLDLPDNFTGKFDLINQRLMLGGILKSEWHTACEALVRSLKPGGWVQFVEYAGITGGPKTQLYTEVFRRVYEYRDQNHQPGDDIPSLLQEFGLKNISSFERHRSLGKWAGQDGERARDNLINTFKAYAGAVLEAGGVGLLGSEEDYNQLMIDLEAEWDKHEGSRDNWIVIYGQKPDV